MQPGDRNEWKKPKDKAMTASRQKGVVHFVGADGACSSDECLKCNEPVSSGLPALSQGEAVGAELTAASFHLS